MVEVIWIALVLVLELVEEVENIKGECRRRTVYCCRKPACTEELIVFEKGSITTAVADNKLVNARQIEHHEIVKRGGVRARIINVVPELDDKTGSGEGDVLKVPSVPHLRYVSINDTHQVPNDPPEPRGVGCSHGTKLDNPCIPVLPKNS